MRWRRLGLTTGAVLIFTGMLVTGVVGGVAAILAREWSGTAAAWLAIALPAGGAFIGCTCRLPLVGTYVGDHGLRIRTPLRTVTVHRAGGPHPEDHPRELRSVAGRDGSADVPRPRRRADHRASAARRAPRGSAARGGCPTSSPWPSSEPRHRHHTQGRPHETNS